MRNTFIGGIIAMVEKDLIYLVFFIVLPYFVTLFLYKQELKSNSVKKIILIDVLSFVFFMIYAYIHFYIKSVTVAAMSSDSTFRYMSVVYFRNLVGMLCSILYSYMINFKLMEKYLVKLKIIKYKGIIFFIFFLIDIFLVKYFISLCHIW